AALRWARRAGPRRRALVEIATLEVVAACLGDLIPRAACPRRAAARFADAPLPGSAEDRSSPPACLASALPTNTPPPMAAGVDGDWPASGVPAGRPGGARPAVLPCADGYVALSAPSAIDRDLLAGLTGIDAVRAPDADLGREFAAWLAAHTRDEIFHAAQLWRLPILPVLSPDQVYADAQCAARGVWVGENSRRVARSPFRFSAIWSNGVKVGRGLVPRRLACGVDRAEGDKPLPYENGLLSLPTSHSDPLPGREGGLPLGDLCVLDLGMVWAGPYCGRLLAGLGARVMKIEGPTRRDGTRPADPAGCAGAFGDLNRGKESVVLDLASSGGRAAFLRLAARADAVLENFSPRVMPNFALDYAVLANANPALLMLSMPAFGASGPWAQYVAYGSGLELVTGLAATLDGRPVPAPVAYLDYLAGAYGAAGLLAALLARDGSGRGAHVELAQREVACQLLADAEALEAAPAPWSLDVAALAADPHLRARGLFATPPAANGAHCYHYARLPWRLHGVPLPAERPAPLFGADSRRVLAEVAAGLGHS
ncbi:MAG TPA: CoA transferase, partial [Chloroflexota bacterium]